MTNQEVIVFLAFMASNWLCVWLGVDIERTKNRHIKETQYKLDNEKRKRGN